jgi:site-specific DNA-methyltransferase (adenine-specific)/modification methylase
MTGRVETIGECTLYLGDCRDILPTLGPVDAVVTDPPYGIGESAGKAKTRTTGFSPRVKGVYQKDYGDDDWDDKPIDADLMDMVRAAGRWNIIFGGNYYPLPATSCWLVWDKLNGDTDFADCELAWTNLPKAVRRVRYLWNGCMRANGEKRGDHPTQKPIGVMRWALTQLPADAKTIIDPFMGSGTTGVACALQGLSFVGIEREAKYFDAACRRIEEAYRQPRLFSEPVAKPVQTAFNLEGAQ